MKYKVGDRVRIKSLDWYRKYANKNGIVVCGNYYFTQNLLKYCGKILMITNVIRDFYVCKDVNYQFSDEMIEELVEEESEKKLSDESWKPSKEEMDVLYSLAYITNQYDKHKEEIIIRLYQDLKREFFNGSSYENMFPDTEDDVRRRSTIQVLEYARSLDNYNQYGKEDIDKNIAWLEKQGKKPQGKSALEAINEKNIDNQNCVKPTNKVEPKFHVGESFNLPQGYQFVDENGNVINATKIVLEKKEKEYPKSYEECCKVLGYSGNYNMILTTDVDNKLFNALYRLKVCRDVYWKIAGEEMGLGKPWVPDYDSGVDKFGIIFLNGVVQESNPTTNWERHLNKVLDFPTREMRDAFYENFKELIESVKELL